MGRALGFPVSSTVTASRIIFTGSQNFNCTCHHFLVFLKTFQHWFYQKCNTSYERDKNTIKSLYLLVNVSYSTTSGRWNWGSHSGENDDGVLLGCIMCSLAEVHWRFGGTFYLHSDTPQKTAIFKLTVLCPCITPHLPSNLLNSSRLDDRGLKPPVGEMRNL